MDSFLRSFFEKVYVEMAEKPQAWGRFHICFTVIGLAVVITAALLIRKKQSFKLYNGTLRAVGFFLMLCEIFKLAYNYYNLCGSDYNRWIYLFPFQLCSVPMYLAVIASFLRRGCRLRTALLTFMMTYTFMSGLAAFIEPSGILHADLFSTMHSCAWHMLLVFLGLLIGFYGEVGQELGHFGLAVITFVGCCALALVLNLILPLTMTAEGSTPNMFYIGPARSSLVVFKDIYDRFGWVVQCASYMFSLTVGAFIMFLPFRLAKLKKV